MRLIDADALMEEVGISNICEDCEFNADPFCDLRGGSVCRAIRNAPTIESKPVQGVTTVWTDGEPPVYAPVRHSVWVKMSDRYGYYFCCNSCGYDRTEHKYSYCPNCGAKMNGVEE